MTSFDVDRGRDLALATEDAGIRAAERVESVDVFPRVLPPFDWEGLRGREIDVVGVADAGIILIEIKRESGRLPAQRGGRTYRVSTDTRTKVRRNPFTDIHEKRVAVAKSLAREPGLSKLTEAWRQRGLGGIPVTPMICFGPRSDISAIKDSDAAVVVCTTLNMRRELSAAIERLPRVEGTRAALGPIFAGCKFQGILTLPRVRWTRARLKRVAGATALGPRGIVYLDRERGEGLRVLFADGRSLTTSGDVHFSLSAKEGIVVPDGNPLRWRVHPREWRGT